MRKKLASLSLLTSATAAINCRCTSRCSAARCRRSARLSP
jgi:hypothetical protein